MATRDQVVTWARKQADELQSDMTFVPSGGGYGGYWDVEDLSKKGLLMARAAAGLDFLRTHAGPNSEWLRRGATAYDSKGDHSSLAGGVYALGNIVRLWADQVEAGVVRLPAELSASVRAVATTDVMEQVRALNEDRLVHPAAPIVLAGAALETALRTAVEQRSLTVKGKPGISAYADTLRAADVITKQDVKDVVQIAGVRNAAAHGEFEDLSRERAGLMEQQVNFFLRRLDELLDPHA